MDFLKKESASETTQSFTQRVPLGEKQSQNTSYVSQIQELMALLVQKKAQIKQAKLKQANLLGKQEQQHVRIGKIKVGMEHQIEKEQVLRTQQDRLQQQICVCKQSIKELTKCVKTIKGQLSDLLENIISSKKNKAELETVCSEIQCLITGKTTENAKIDEQIQNLETLILSCQNDVRSKQDQLTNLQIEKTELCTLLDFLEQKMKMATRAKNSCQAQNNEICQQILKSEQKIQNIKKEANEIEWSCQQIRSQNNQIEDLNRRLLTDLEGVRKHLAMMEKMNQLLQNSLTEFDMTGDKVTRLINAAKSY